MENLHSEKLDYLLRGVRRGLGNTRYYFGQRTEEWPRGSKRFLRHLDTSGIMADEKFMHYFIISWVQSRTQGKQARKCGLGLKTSPSFSPRKYEGREVRRNGAPCLCPTEVIPGSAHFSCLKSENKISERRKNTFMHVTSYPGTVPTDRILKANFLALLWDELREGAGYIR